MNTITTSISNETLINFFNEIECDDFCSFEEVDKELLQDVYNAIQAFRNTNKTVKFNHKTIAKHFEFQSYEMLGTKVEDDALEKLQSFSKEIIEEFEPGKDYGSFLDIEGTIDFDDVWAATAPEDAEDADEYLTRILSAFQSWDDTDDCFFEYIMKNSGCYNLSTQQRMIKEFADCDWYENSNVFKFYIHIREALQMAYYRDCEKRGLNGDTYCVQPYFSHHEDEFYKALMKESIEDLFILSTND